MIRAKSRFFVSAIRFILVGLLLSTSFFSAVGVAAKSKIKIGFVLATLQEERYQKDQKYFNDEADKLGFEAVIVSADNKDNVQTAKIENLLSMGVKAIVIQPVNSQAAGSLVKLAHDDKVPVVAYDRLITDAPVDFYVTQDSFKVGVLQAEAAVKKTGVKGNYMILMGQAGHSVANEITSGVLSVLDKYPQIKVVVKKNHDSWSPAQAMATVENALTKFNNKIDAILANNSGMARGAVQALVEQKLEGKVFVAGADADLSAIKDIVAGRQQFEVLKDIAPLAQTAAQVAFMLAKGEKPKSTGEITNGRFKIPVVATPVYAITLENLEQKIFATGFHLRKAVYSDAKKQ